MAYKPQHTNWGNISQHVNRANLRQSVGINNGLAFVNGKYMPVSEYEKLYPAIALISWYEMTKGKNPDGKSLA